MLLDPRAPAPPEPGATARAPFDMLAFYRGLAAAAPASASLRAQLAAALLAAGQAEAAVTESEAACAADPTCLAAWLTRASAHQSRRDFPAVISCLERAVALAPSHPGIATALGNALAEHGQMARAAEALRRAVVLDPQNTAALANLGGVYLRQGQTELAVAACQDALAHDPGIVSAHQNLATALADTNPVAARVHRDTAYRRQSVFIEAAIEPWLTVLVLTAAGPGNVPLEHLLPRAHVTLIRWYVEYARADHPRDLPCHDAIFNAIGDPDFAPDLDPAVRGWLRDRGVMNAADRVAATSRDALPCLLAGIEGVVVPAAIRLARGDAAARAAMATREPPLLPALVRPVGAHGGEGVRLARSTADRDAALTAEGEYYVTAFVDSRGADGMYRKYRAIFVDRVPYPYHLAITPDWLVHYWTAGMEHNAAHRMEEARFLNDPRDAIGERAWAAIAAIGARLDLDYAGIDFSVLPGGDVLVFEANATMSVHPEDDPIFDYKNPAVARILGAFEKRVSESLRGATNPR